MLDSIIEDKKFADVMQKNIENLLLYLFEREHYFGILCKIEHVVFEPPLPKELSAEFRSMKHFILEGYT